MIRSKSNPNQDLPHDPNQDLPSPNQDLPHKPEFRSIGSNFESRFKNQDSQIKIRSISMNQLIHL